MWNIEQFCGYKPITTFWDDFTIADCFGVPAVTDTFRRAFNEWKDNYKYLTELVMVLNHKIWQHNERRNDLAEAYDALWRIADQYAMENLTGEAAEYFYQVTD